MVEMFISKEEIAEKVTELATLIKNDYKGEHYVVLGTLKGSFIFMSDLVRELEDNITIEFIRISSYGDFTSPQSRIRFDQSQEIDITNKHVLIVEDIIDTGQTIRFLSDYLQCYKPKSLKVCSLLDKPERRKFSNIRCDYIGFTVSNEFVVGYGLDYAQKYRNLPYIGILRSKEV